MRYFPHIPESESHWAGTVTVVTRRQAGAWQPSPELGDEMLSATPSPERVALNRMAFGARQGDEDLVRQMGYADYVEAQLRPALDQGLDLAITTDHRRVLAEVLVKRAGQTRIGEVFPTLGSAAPLGLA